MSESIFKLHPQLDADTTLITEFNLCLVLLINDANYPWCVLVPKRPDTTEIYKLPRHDQTELLVESERLCHAMEALFQPDKMNIAAIGNMVPQLHVHHIARFKNDTAWPAPVWGHTQAVPYHPDKLNQTLASMQQALTRSA